MTFTLQQTSKEIPDRHLYAFWYFSDNALFIFCIWLCLPLFKIHSYATNL